MKSEVCYYCQYFLSFANQYGDDQEPHDLGTCRHLEAVIPDGYEKKPVTSEDTCELFK